MAAAPQYQFVTQERNGAQIADLLAIKSPKLLFQLGQPGMVTAGISASHPLAHRGAGLTAGTHELVVYRNGVPLETVFQLVRESWKGDANTTDLAFEWHGIASYLQHGKILGQSSVWSDTDLPWQWIDAFQGRDGGDYGIVQGAVHGTPPNRQVALEEDTGLFEEVARLAGTGDGFDWGVDTNRAYVEWHAQRGRDTGIVLEHGVNISEFSGETNTAPGEIISDIRGYGAPGTMPITGSDAVTRARYGRREASIALSGASDTAIVQDAVDAALAGYSTPLSVPTFKLIAGHPSIPFGSYWLGDIVTYRVRIGRYDWINQPFRIVQIEIAPEDAGEKIAVGVNPL